MRAKIKVIHLSDLHFPDPLSAANVHDRGKKVIHSSHHMGNSTSFFLDYCKTIPRDQYDDIIIVVTGDLTKNADSDGLQKCELFLKECCDALKIPFQNVIIAPGNHDIQRGAEPDLQFDNFKNYTRDFCTPFTTPRYYEKPDCLLVFPLNSSEVMTPDENINKNKGWFKNAISKWTDSGKTSTKAIDIPIIAQEQLREMKLATSTSTAKMRIVLLHHHLVPVWDNEAKEFGFVLNAGPVIRDVQEAGFSIVLHGHKHTHSAKVITDLEAQKGPFPVCVIGSRTFADRDAWFNEIEINIGVKTTVLYQRYCFENGLKRDHDSPIPIHELLKLESGTTSVLIESTVTTGVSK